MAGNPSTGNALLGRVRSATRTLAWIGAAATVVNGTASGKSSDKEWMSIVRMMVPSAIVASSIAKWSPMHDRGPPPNGMYCQRSRLFMFCGLNRSGSNTSASSHSAGSRCMA